MDDNELQQVNTTEETVTPSKGKKRRHWGLLALILALVLAATALTTMEDGRHFAAFRRWLMYGDDSRQENLYVYAQNKGNQWGRLGDDLLVVSPNGAELCKNDGTDIYRLSLTTKNPALSVGKNLAAVCDIGGDVIYILDHTGLKETLRAEGGLHYYSARLNGEDILAVTGQKNGYKTAVSVYDRNLELLFSFASHDTYINDAVVTEDGKHLAAVRMDTQDGVFASELLTYSMAAAEEESSTVIQDGLVLDIRSSGDRILSLCDERLMITDLDGNIHMNCPYGSLYLHGCALGGKDFCGLLLGRYQSGNICTLTTYNFEGEELASLELTEEVLDLSAAGDRLAVLYSNSLVIYDRELKEKARLDSTDYAGRVLMCSDGTALVIGGTTTVRFLP